MQTFEQSDWSKVTWYGLMSLHCHTIINLKEFEVRGKNLGQPGGVPPPPYCTVDSTNPCTATCSGYKFDTSRVLNYPYVVVYVRLRIISARRVTTIDNANNSYTFSPCFGTPCGPLNAVRYIWSTVLLVSTSLSRFVKQHIEMLTSWLEISLVLPGLY